jgi:signal transduction histidine kinase
MKVRFSVAFSAIALIVGLAALRRFPSLLSANYLPHRFCYLAQSGLIWTNVTMDGLIAASYATIFFCLLWLTLRLRGASDIRQYLWIFFSFGLFIAACGATHVMEMVTVWWPLYPLSATIKVLCAAASVPTAVLFARATPTLSRSVSGFLDLLAGTRNERDEALSSIGAFKRLIAERQLAADNLAAANERLNAVMDSTSEGILKLDPNWEVVYGNRIARETLPEFKIGANLWESFPALGSTIAQEKLRTAMEDRIATEYEVFYEAYKCWYAVRAFPTRDGLSVFFSDLTAVKKLQTQLAHEQMLRERRIEVLSIMAGGLAHEISNPLAIIHARASDLQLLAETSDCVPAPQVDAACHSIVNTSDRAMKILRGLRTFGREAGNDPMQWASIYDIAEQALDVQYTRFERHRIELRVSMQPGIPVFLCRETQIGQIVTNLLNNAFDAITHNKSEVRWVALNVGSNEREIFLDVIDSGPGVDPSIRAQLMEPFFTTKKDGLGMGVGLSLSRSFAQDHGGSLSLCDDTLQTRFRLVLPLPAEAITPSAEATLEA